MASGFSQEGYAEEQLELHTHRVHALLAHRQLLVFVGRGYAGNHLEGCFGLLCLLPLQNAFIEALNPQSLRMWPIWGWGL